jgi:hypothetical protein
MDAGEIIKTGVRSIAASFPVAGSLANAWNEYESNKKLESITKYFEILKEELDDIKENINQDYIGKSEAARLLEQTCKAAQDEVVEEKIKIYAKFYSTSLTDLFSQRNDKESVLNIIKLLSVAQLTRLNIIMLNIPIGQRRLEVKEYKDGDIHYVYGDFIVKLAESQGLNASDVFSDIYYLISLGCVETQGNRGYSQVGGKTGVMGLRPTHLGVSVIEYLERDIQK